MFSFYSQYRGRSVGRILHALNVYCNLHIAEHASVSENKVYYPSDKLFATFEWEGEDVPVLTFLDHNKELYTKNQEEKKPYLDDTIGWHKKLYRDCLVDKLEKMIKVEKRILNPGCDDEINYKEVLQATLKYLKVEQ